MKIHQKRGILVDNKCPRKFVKNFHENSPYENVHENSLILKNSVHENSLSTRVLHPLKTVRKKTNLSLTMVFSTTTKYLFKNLK